MLCRFDPERFTKSGGDVRHRLDGWRDDGIRFGVDLFVFGVGVYRGDSRLLVDAAQDGKPNWYSVRDLIIVENSLSQDFKSHFDPNSEDWTVLIGYEALVKSEEHFNGLLNRAPGELEHFRQVANQFGSHQTNRFN